MDEFSNKETFFLDDNQYLRKNSTESNVIFSKKLKIKYYYNFLISLIITILCITEYIITLNYLINIKNNFRDIDNEEFNISNVYYTNDICENKKQQIDLNKYFDNINDYIFSRNLIIKFEKVSFFDSIILIVMIQYINYLYKTEKNTKVNFNILSFISCIILFISQIIIFISFLYSFLRLFEIINFLEKNDCFKINKLNIALILLKRIIQNILILACFSICIFQVIIYFVKKLIIINEFFFYQTDPNKNINNNDKNNDGDDNNNINTTEEKKYSNINILSDVD